jgi:aminoglycoside 6-adenylyltransferase
MVTNDTGFLNEIIQWADGRPDIIALIMTGSRAQPNGVVDDLSDYDLEIFTSDPPSYTSSDEWMSDIASVWVYLPTTSNGRCETRLVVFDGGVKVDFSILVDSLEHMIRSQTLDELHERGYRVLIDKKGLASRLPAPSYTSPVRLLPSEAEFEAAVEEFWLEASHIPKYLQRDDRWVVKFRDWTMKELLLQMLE